MNKNQDSLEIIHYICTQKTNLKANETSNGYLNMAHNKYGNTSCRFQVPTP